MAALPPGDHPLTLKAAAFALFLCLLWGGLTPAIKIALQGIPPLALAGWRFLLALVSIWLWCVLNRVDWKPARKYHWHLMALGLVFAAQIGAINVGTQLTSANHAVVLLNTAPIFFALLAHLFIPGDRLDRRKSLGLGVAFAGLVLIFWDTPRGEGLLEGNVLALLSGVLLAVIYLISKSLLRKLSAIQIVLWQMIYGVPLFFLASLLLGERQASPPGPAVTAAVLYLGLIIAGFCFVAWTQLLQRYIPSRLTSLQFSIPVFGVVLSWFLLGESTNRQFLAGVGLVAAGIYTVTSAPFESYASETPEM